MTDKFGPKWQGGRKEVPVSASCDLDVIEMQHPKWSTAFWRVAIVPAMLAVVGVTSFEKGPWWGEFLLWLPMLVGAYAIARMDTSRWVVQPGELRVFGLFMETKVPASRVENVEYFQTNDSVRVHAKPPLRWEMPYSGSILVPKTTRARHRERAADLKNLLLSAPEAEHATSETPIVRTWIRPRVRDIAPLLLLLPIVLATSLP
ncbi:hypothetical protein [Demequina zhanjiangensis]|uniref:PH domain-containing protein n=1 Tax=Demequina zhanjiangensis TaxID=3051659 RepID=A0ABT8FZZ8_9MICO|nr:hypothetical protein [Demequina sp. SYSU T00b26]MDN4472466.1 hypothetical protein [Demequina sp. SYSU T00b26]